MDRTERISAMEKALNTVLAAQERLDAALEEYAAAREDLRTLNAYYGSREWHADRKADEEGLLPPGQKRGVLSEDGIWNALERDRELRSRMEEIAAGQSGENLDKGEKNMDFEALARARFSVRDYKDTPIEEEKLQKILEAGRIAPTAKNSQAHRVYVLQSEEALEKIRAITRCAFNAPVVLLVAYDENEEWVNPLEGGHRSGQQDASIVATHMMLQAWELGIGSCWVNFFPNSRVEESFGLPKNIKSVLLLPIGYPAEGAEPSPRHSQSRPVEELVKFL